MQWRFTEVGDRLHVRPCIKQGPNSTHLPSLGCTVKSGDLAVCGRVDGSASR